MQWSNEARHLFQSYLSEVRAHCRAQGVWAEPVVSSVEKEIQARLSQAGVEQVTQAIARQVLASMGNPAAMVAQGNGGPPPPLPSSSGTSAPPPLPIPAKPVPGLAAHATQPIPKAAPKPPLNRKGPMILVSLICVPILIGVGFLSILPGILQLQASGEKNACADNLLALHGALVGYSNLHDGQLPPLDANGSVPLLFDEEVFEMLDIHWLRCPSDAYEGEEESSIRNDPDYIYLGAPIRTQAELERFIDRYVASGGELVSALADSSLAGTYPPVAGFRADRADADTIPLLVEYNLYHDPDGAHVLYLDGHIEYLEMNSQFPVTDAFYETIGLVWGAGTLKSCRENIQVLGDQLLKIGQANEGRLPTLDTEREPFIFGGDSAAEVDRKRLRCPAMAYDGETEADILADSDYIYLGYAIRNAVEMDAYIDAYAGVEGDLARFVALESIKGPNGDLVPLTMGMPNPGRVPVLIEWNGFHNATGGHVYYLDGHVEFLQFDSQFPMTDRFFSGIRRGRDAKSRPRCETNLQKLGEALLAYSDGAEGDFPRLTHQPHTFLFEDRMLQSIDARLLRCPRGGYEGETDEDIIDDADYLYLGYAVRNQAEMNAFIRAREAAGEDWAAFRAKDSIPSSAGPIPRLHRGLPNPEEIPVMIEWWGHQPSGGHVLYLDGHIEFVERGVKFPMTEEFFDGFYTTWQEEPSAWSEFKKGFWEAMEEEYR